MSDNKVYLTNAVITALAVELAEKLPACARVYGIPRGGIPVAYMLRGINGITIADTPEEAEYLVDDIIDSGVTAAHWEEKCGKPVYALVDRAAPANNGPVANRYLTGWLVFPWEGNEDGSIEDNIRRLLQFIGEDPNREGLLETPKRVAKAYAEWFDGYRTDIPALFKTFTDGAENCDEMIIIDNIPVESFCEHHMARFHGIAHVGYIPNGKIVGLSKIPKLVRVFSHRLQVQERLTNQIADALVEHLKPLGVAVVVQCAHTCMSSRGARVHGTTTTTSAMRGVLLTDAPARAEFMALLPKRGG